MRKHHALNATALAAVLVVGSLLFVSPILAKPGWSHPTPGDLALSAEQREQINNLRSAFSHKLKSLDWSVEEGGHAPETLQRARELRMALRAEVRDILTAEQLKRMDSARRSCPHGGKPDMLPVRQETATLYL